MTFAPELSMVPRLGLEVSPALVSFAEMLMLPYAAMQSVIEEELSCNAALERAEAGDCPICKGSWRTRCPVCAVPATAVGNGARRHSGEPADRPAVESDSAELLRAVRMETAPADARIVEYLVDSLDAHGMLDRSCADLASDLETDESVIANLLGIIRRAGPPGVGATSVTDCLLLQLDALDLDEESAQLARAVITAHLPALAKGRFASIAAALGVTAAEVKQVLELIRSQLRPYPAFDGNSSPVANYVVPDIVVRCHEEIPGEYVVELVEPALTRLNVRRGAPSGASVSQARSFIAQLHDRWETLRRVAEYAVERQKDFFVCGATALRPLTRAEVAADLGLHESTVSRTVADKYALLPDRTIVPLSRFFGSSGGVDGQLRKLLDSADGPVSDQQLADLLCDAGYPIARRTVAKHRARLGYTTAALR